MFVELMPLLKQRTLLITVSRVDEKLKVNVIPTKLKEGEDQALTTPLTFTGSPQELDAELGKQLISYVESHLELASTLAEAVAEMEAAAKAALQKVKSAQATKTSPPVIKREDPAPPVTAAAETTANLFTTQQPSEEPSAQAGREG